MDEDFGIAVGSKTIAFAFELPAKILEVVDRAVEHHANRAVIGQHRLTAVVAEIDDREAAVPEHSSSASGERPRHRGRGVRARRSCGRSVGFRIRGEGGADKSRYATHKNQGLFTVPT